MSSEVSAASGGDDITWSEEEHTLNDAIKTGNLPFLVRLTVAGQGTANTDLKHPMLLYAKRSIRKLRAKSLKSEEGQEKLSRIGSPIAIPDDYPGVFQLMSAECGASGYRNLQDLLRDKVAVFVSATDLKCFREAPAGSDEQYISVRVPKWCPLYPGKMFEGDIQKKVQHKFLRGKHKMVTERVLYVECPDAEGLRLFLPVDTEGIFHAWHEGDEELGKNEKMVYSVSSITKASLPCVVRVVDGPVPSIAGDKFTGLLQIDAVYSESTLVAGIVRGAGAKPLLAEISADPGLRVELPADTHIALEHPSVKKARSLCEQEAGSYMRAMKVIHRVVPSELGDGLARPEDWLPAWQKVVNDGETADPYYYSLRFARSRKSKYDAVTGLFVENADDSKWKAVEIPMDEATSDHHGTHAGNLRVVEDIEAVNKNVNGQRVSVHSSNGSYYSGGGPASPGLSAPYSQQMQLTD